MPDPKPIIIVTGPPRSYTSAVSKFLLFNGGYNDDIWHNEKINYDTYENNTFRKYIKKRKNFLNHDLSHFFLSIPKDKVIVCKNPLLFFFINELRKYTDRRIKVVYTIRNFKDVVISTMQKSGFSFIKSFERITWAHDFMVNIRYPVFPLLVGRLLNKDKFTTIQLLKFCELDTEDIDYSAIETGLTGARTNDKFPEKFNQRFWYNLNKLIRT